MYSALTSGVYNDFGRQYDFTRKINTTNYFSRQIQIKALLKFQSNNYLFCIWCIIVYNSIDFVYFQQLLFLFLYHLWWCSSSAYKITPGSAQKTRWDAWYQIWVDHIQGKWPTQQFQLLFQQLLGQHFIMLKRITYGTLAYT